MGLGSTSVDDCPPSLLSCPSFLLGSPARTTFSYRLLVPPSRTTFSPIKLVLSIPNPSLPLPTPLSPCSSITLPVLCVLTAEWCLRVFTRTKLYAPMRVLWPICVCIGFLPNNTLLRVYIQAAVGREGIDGSQALLVLYHRSRDSHPPAASYISQPSELFPIPWYSHLHKSRRRYTILCVRYNHTSHPPIHGEQRSLLPLGGFFREDDRQSPPRAHQNCYAVRTRYRQRPHPGATPAAQHQEQSRLDW